MARMPSGISINLDLVEHLADQADRLAEATGRADLRHAARLMRGDRRGGRRPVDDTAALELVQQLIIDGRGTWSACMGVARGLNPDKAESVARRLFNKIPKQQVFSGASPDTAVGHGE
jgi:hypothetical protein